MRQHKKCQNWGDEMKKELKIGQKIKIKVSETENNKKKEKWKEVTVVQKYDRFTVVKHKAGYNEAILDRDLVYR